jgi:phage terminase Nu1 subunit (DNA packaging protein)
MLRQSLFVGGLVFVLASAALFGVPHAQLAQSQEMSLNAVKSAVLAATGYDGEAVELTATKVQFVVTIVNSKLNGSPAAERENEATHIASKIASIIANKPEFKGIQAIHVDYVKREADSGHTQTIDGIDFRRDPQGNFQRHIT